MTSLGASLAGAGPRRYFARWELAERPVVVVRSTDLEVAVTACRYLAGAGLAARVVPDRNGKDLAVTVPRRHCARARAALFP